VRGIPGIILEKQGRDATATTAAAAATVYIPAQITPGTD